MSFGDRLRTWLSIGTKKQQHERDNRVEDAHQRSRLVRRRIDRLALVVENNTKAIDKLVIVVEKVDTTLSSMQREVNRLSEQQDDESS